MEFPISTVWNMDRNFINEDSSKKKVRDCQSFSLIGFPAVTYFLTMEYQFPENYHQLIRNHEEAYGSLRISLNCICDYKSFKAEIKLKYTFEEKESDLLELVFDDEHTVMECFSEPKWDHFKFYSFNISVEGTMTVKKMFSIPIEICLDSQNLITEKESKDFAIIAQGQEIKVHKTILTHVSPVFARMLEEPKWKESMEGRIEIPLLPFKLLEIAIDAFYGEKYPKFLNPKEYIQIYQFADQYDITALKNAVKNSMILVPKNIVEYVNLSVECKVVELINHCIDYLFICSQYSIFIPNKNSLSDESKNAIAEKIFESSVLKRDLVKENTVTKIWHY